MQQNPITLKIKQFGNTPACAGKTSTFCGRACDDQKHPRMRGEDSSREALKFT